MAWGIWMHLYWLCNEQHIEPCQKVPAHIWFFTKRTRYEQIHLSFCMKWCINHFTHSGTFFFATFFVFQISTITCVFLTISSLFPQGKEMTYWQRMMGTLSFVFLAYYYITVLYFITMTAEKAHQDLKMLASPLQQALVMETEQPKIQSLKILLKEVANVGPLSGNGYFDISRGTLTSIVSISVTYFIILLQFKTGWINEK